MTSLGARRLWIPDSVWYKGRILMSVGNDGNWRSKTLQNDKIITMINANVGTLRLIVFGIRYGRWPSQFAVQPGEKNSIRGLRPKV